MSTRDDGFRPTPVSSPRAMTKPAALSQPDEGLVMRARNGDRDAFGELVRTHQRRVWRVCRQYLGSDEAEAATQDTLVKAYTSLASFDGRSAFTTWLTGTANPVAAGPLVQLTLAVVALRIGMAVLQWVSRVYVLTNRRVMRIRGVFRASVFACPLVKVINTGITVDPHEKLTRLGSIWFNTGTDSQDGTWYHVTHPEEIHDQIRRAIERALDAHH